MVTLGDAEQNLICRTKRGDFDVKKRKTQKRERAREMKTGRMNRLFLGERIKENDFEKKKNQNKTKQTRNNPHEEKKKNKTKRKYGFKPITYVLKSLANQPEQIGIALHIGRVNIRSMYVRG